MATRTLVTGWRTEPPAAGGPVDDGVTCAVREDDGVVTVGAAGGLSLASSLGLSATLRKHLLDRGRVLVDIAALRVEWPPSVSVFSTVLAAAGGWPVARMVLFGASPETGALLRSTGSTLAVPLAADRAQALELQGVRPGRVRRTVPLPASPVAAAYGRSLVRQACADWGVADPGQRVEVVANELISNAVQHCAGESVLVLSHDRRGLTVAVRDGSAQLPTAADPGEAQDVHLGLRVVQGLSDSWGVLRLRHGKTVWALVRDA
jgi:hypothetical protein